MPEIEPFQLDKIRVSHLFKLHDLSADAAASEKLAGEMKKDELIRLDLFCQLDAEGPRCRAVRVEVPRHLVVFTDAFAHERLKKKSPTEVMIFTEAMTPE